MEPTLFSFIWKYSKRQQLWLLGFTLLTFPFLYVTLELPKRIINDAIGAETSTITLFGTRLSQIEYLMALCGLFLAAVLVSGLMKMRLNTMKGVLSERLLRRLRYQLISRMMRFPRPYFRTTSQGELVAMVTAEAEPMGGLMGDAVAQPVFQAGQMLTITAFLFLQSVWFGLAAVALIPLQAWLIPKLQRQINLLNKDRIKEVRHLAAEIGESAAGISDLRANGGWRYRLAVITARLGVLFDIRFRIYQKKFFMKFINNFITQLTPFLFYSVGGVLVIRGEVTVGALVAALAAYKDLSGPWRDLLTYYNQVQDMSLRWEVVTERFAPRGMIREDLFEGQPSEIPHLRGPIELKNVTVRDEDGNTILEDISLSVPPGARVAIQSGSATERAAFALLLTREVLPVRGEVILSGHDLNELHQTVIAARIGYAHSRPYLFDGTLGDNLLMSLKIKPQEVLWDPKKHDRAMQEAIKTGNSTDVLNANWIDPGLAGLSDGEEIRDWWFKLVEAMGIDEAMYRRTLRSRFNPDVHPVLARRIIELRPEIQARLKQRGLDDVVFHYDPDAFNPAVPLGGNLLFAAPTRNITQDQLARDDRLIRLLESEGLAQDALSLAQVVLATLRQTFGRDGTDHPLFLRLGIDPDMYHRLIDIAEKRATTGDAGLTREDKAVMMTVPFLLTAEQIGPGFPETYKQRILAIRKTQGADLRRQLSDLFTAVESNAFVPALTVVENAIFGRVSIMAGARAAQVEDVVAEVLDEHGLRRRVASIMYDLPTGLGGANLPTVLQERAAFSRAGIKRPDILIIDNALASHDAQSRHDARERLRTLMPDSIIFFLENHFENPAAYDLFVEIRNGRIDDLERYDQPEEAPEHASDLEIKLQVIGATALFSGLDRRHQRLLAFSASWYDAEPGQVIFAHDDPADAAYLCTQGQAELRWPTSVADTPPVSVVEPGRLIGDLSVILGEPRQLDLVATAPSRFLRIGAEEFRAVIENDAEVAVNLLETVSRNLTDLAELLHAANIDLSELTRSDKGRRSLQETARGLNG